MEFVAVNCSCFTGEEEEKKGEKAIARDGRRIVVGVRGVGVW